MSNDKLAQVFHFDLFGKREFKYDFLKNNSLKTINYVELPNIAPDYFFVNKNFEEKAVYENGFAVNELFKVNSVGIVTANDDLYISKSKQKLKEQILKKYQSIDVSLIRPISYRPFDNRFLYNNVDMLERSRARVMQHFLKNENMGLVCIRRSRKSENWCEIFCVDKIISGSTTISSLDINYVFPLYLYPETQSKQKKLFPISESDKRVLEMNMQYAKNHFKQVNDFFNKTVLPFYQNLKNPTENEKSLFEENKSAVEESKTAFENIKRKLEAKNVGKIEEQTFESIERIPNLNTEIVNQIAKNLGLTFTNEKEKTDGTFAPIDILDYIYAVLHSPAYREKYKEFLKIDFPRVPYPKTL